jgi:2'-5' RNA ligase
LLRLFAAIEVPGEIAEELAHRQTGLPGARWRPTELMHITLRFFGQVSEPVAADLDAELARTPGKPFTLALEGAGCFAERAVWAGVRESEPLKILAGRCESAARRAGVKPEARKYHPHLTLAYLRGAEPEKAAAWVAKHNLLRSPDFLVTWFGLYSSWSGPDGSRYDLEREYPLL